MIELILGTYGALCWLLFKKFRVIPVNTYTVFTAIGIGAVIGFDVIVGTWSIVAEGCVVPKGNIIPDEKIVAGTPFQVLGNIQDKHKKFWTYGKQLYIDLAKEYPDKIERIG